ATCSVTILTCARLGVAAGGLAARSIATTRLRATTALLVVVLLGARQHCSAALTVPDDLTVEDPHLDADDAVGRAGACGAVVDVGPEGLQRNAAIGVPLGAGLFGATEATGAADLDAAGSRLH